MVIRLGKSSLPLRPAVVRPARLVRGASASRRRMIARFEDGTAADPVTSADDVAENSAEELTPEVADVTFEVVRHVEYGQTVTLVGNVDSLGNWDPEASVPMLWSEGDVWTAQLALPLGSLEFKYLVKDADGSLLEWYGGENLVTDIISSDGMAVKNHWGMLGYAEETQEEVQEHAAEEIVEEVKEMIEEPVEEETPIEEVKEEPQVMAAVTEEVQVVEEVKEAKKTESDEVDEMEPKKEMEASAAVESILETDATVPKKLKSGAKDEEASTRSKKPKSGFRGLF